MAIFSRGYLLSLSLSLLLLFDVSLAQFGEQGRSPFGSQRRFGSQSRCRIERLNAQEPRRRVESEAGLTEYFDEDNEQFECAGVAAHRRIVQPGGLVLPKFYNAHALTYVVQGKGIFGNVMPGCPESFQSFQRGDPRTSREEGRRGRSERDQHQRVDHFREGDIIAIPAGVAHWVYNDGEQPIVAFTVLDTSNNANQLDSNRREFLLAGRKGRGQHLGVEPREDSDDFNLLSGFDTESLAESMGISRDLAEKLRGRSDDRGEIVRVEGSFHIVRPSRREEGMSEGEEREREYEEEERERERRRLMANGLEQAFCSVGVKRNIDDPRRADIYNPNAGRTTTLNSQKLPLLRYLQLNAVRGVLHRNAFVAPHWNMNAHSIMYVTRGNARLQIVNDRGNTAFNGELRQNQLIVVPQNFALLIQSRSENFEWVAIKTNDNAMVSPIVGKTSVFKGLPEEVLRNAYRVSREEARMLKYNRGEEMVVLVPHSSQSRGRAEA
ncbi:glutelin type-A 1-like [Asparagus officinalis]|uniref:glutelin type-A 1-like n=1 Tax=Asparagus officinalis TaxID=4686 RepID=UPI00098E2B09|nr:glutelin type-A 1-like [Asparagus officinalis]